MPRLTYTMTRGTAIFDVEVWYRCVPAYTGATDGRHGPKLEPDEPASIEVDFCEGPDGMPLDTTEQEDTEIHAACVEHANDMHDWFEPEEFLP